MKDHISRLLALELENEEARAAQAEMRPRFERMAHRNENGTAPRAVSAYQLFQTPATMAAELAALLELKPGARVLEPSAGLGRLLDAVAPYMPAEVVAVEFAPQIAAELYRQNRPGMTLKQRDFLTLTPADIGTFDAVIMNPPFHMRADIRHIQHARKFLKPGGRLAAICMDTPHRREALSDADQWIDLPRSSFKESGTNVNAAVVIYSAVESGRAMEPEILNENESDATQQKFRAAQIAALNAQTAEQMLEDDARWNAEHDAREEARATARGEM